MLASPPDSPGMALGSRVASDHMIGICVLVLALRTPLLFLFC